MSGKLKSMPHLTADDLLAMRKLTGGWRDVLRAVGLYDDKLGYPKELYEFIRRYMTEAGFVNVDAADSTPEAIEKRNIALAKGTRIFLDNYGALKLTWNE